IFGYFFYWTVHEDFPPASLADLGWQWPSSGLLLVVAAWTFTQLARRSNRRDRPLLFYGTSNIAALCATLGCMSLVWALMSSGLDPQQHVYPAMVYLLLSWSTLHVALGVIMLGYCVARRWGGRM